MNTNLCLAITLSLLLLALTGCSDNDLIGADSPHTGADSPHTGADSPHTGAESLNLLPASLKTIPDVSGTWTWTESQQLVVSAEIGFLWGLDEYPGDPIHLDCTSGGELELEQVGATITGVGSQESSCHTPDGVPTPTVPFPQGDEALGIEGHIAGRAVHFEALVGDGFYCPYRGSLRVSGGVATKIRASGRCEIPIEVRPLNDAGISFEAVR